MTMILDFFQLTPAKNEHALPQAQAIARVRNFLCKTTAFANGPLAH